MIPAQDAQCHNPKCLHEWAYHCTLNSADKPRTYCHHSMCSCMGFSREYDPYLGEFQCPVDKPPLGEIKKMTDEEWGKADIDGDEYEQEIIRALDNDPERFGAWNR